MEFGFVFHGTKTTSSGAENVYLKDFTRKADPKHPRKTFPRLSPTKDVYIVPIKPEYHTELFPDSILRTESPLDYVENEPHRNAISKLYVCHSMTRSLTSGDTLVFYRTGGIYKGVATTIGIVEEVITDIKSAEHLSELCMRRTALKPEEFKEYWERNPKNRPFVINFLYTFSFKKRMTLKEMLDRGIVPSMESIRTVNKIEMKGLRQLISLSGI